MDAKRISLVVITLMLISPQTVLAQDCSKAVSSRADLDAYISTCSARSGVAFAPAKISLSKEQSETLKEATTKVQSARKNLSALKESNSQFKKQMAQLDILNHPKVVAQIKQNDFAEQEAQTLLSDKESDLSQSLSQMTTPAPANDAGAVPTSGDETTDIAKKYKDFISARFGVAVGAAHGLGAQRVDSASIVNGVVRTDESQRDRPLIGLEAHYFLQLEQLPSRDFVAGNRFFGFGPFVSIQASSDSSSISSFGLGLMFGLSDAVSGSTIPTDGSLSSWNLGVGLMIDGSVKHLGDGLASNQPTQETQVRYKTTSGRSAFVMLSRTF